MTPASLHRPGPTRSAYDRLRPLGCGERFFHLYAQNFPVHFCLAAQVDGALREAELYAALDRVRAQFEALRVCIRDVPGAGPAFADTERPIELRVHRADAGAHWSRLVEAELDRPFPATPGPLMRVAALLQPDGACLVLTLHHAVADALSGIRLLDALMHSLAGDRLEAVRPLPPIEAMLAESERDAAALLPHAEPPVGFTGSPGTGALLRSARIAALAWEAAETDRLIEACRAKGATIHGAVCAAAARHVPAADGEPVRFHSPMDLSRLTGREVRDCGVYIGPGVVELPAARGTFWGNAVSACGQVRAARSRPRAAAMLDHLAAVIPPTATADRIGPFFASQPASSGVISNLGALTLQDRYGSRRLTSVWGPAMLTNPPSDRQAIGLLTFGGRLHFVHQSHEPIPGLLESMRDTILRACGPDLPHRPESTASAPY